MKASVYLFFLLANLVAASLMAQHDPTGLDYCGYHDKSEWLVRYQAGEFPRGQKSNTTRYVPLNIVFTGNDDGGDRQSPRDFLESMQLLNQDFRAQNIQFYISGRIQYVDNSDYNSHNSRGGAELRANHRRSGHINTYFVADPAGACGYYSPNFEGVVNNQSCIGGIDRTWAHEMGHFLSLPHTFYGWESVESIDSIKLDEPAPATVRFRGTNVPVERVDGSNCEQAADGFCDTTPDYLMQRWGCNGTREYPDSLLDPDSTRFAVPAFNVMSYAFDRCVNGFTNDQQAAMFANLNSRRNLIRPNVIDTFAADVADFEIEAPLNRTRLPFGNPVTFTWKSVPNADFYAIEINQNSNFTGAVAFTTVVYDTTLILDNILQENRLYYWRVRPVNNFVVNGAFSDVFAFRNGRGQAPPSATIDAAFNAALTVAPNPVAGGMDLRVDAQDLASNGTLEYALIDATGREVYQRTGISITGRGFSERIPTARFSPGMYFLRLRLNGKLVTRRVIVTP